MAAYTTRLSAQAKAQHLPLGQALRSRRGPPTAASCCRCWCPCSVRKRQGWLKAMVDSGEIFHPLRWSPSEAARFLNSVPELESAGVVVRMPANWRAGRPPRPKVTGTVGAREPAGVGLGRSPRLQHGGDAGGQASHWKGVGRSPRRHRDAGAFARTMGGVGSYRVWKRRCAAFKRRRSSPSMKG